MSVTLIGKVCAFHSMSDQGRTDVGRTTLPDGFFENLTDRQRAMLEILVDADGEYVEAYNIRQQMRDNYNMTVPHKPGATNALLGGFTRRYSRSFRDDLIPGKWTDDSERFAAFRAGSKYFDELSSRL
jgi:hypothetical protein